MARIPINTYQQRTAASDAGLGRGPSSSAGQGASAMGAALSSVANLSDRFAEAERRTIEEDAVVSANSELMQSRSDWAQRYLDAQQKAGPGAPDFTPTILAEFDKDAAERVARMQSPVGKRFLQERLQQVRLGLHEDAIHFEAQSRSTDQKSRISSAVDAGMTAAEFRPDDFGQILSEQQLAIAGSGLPATEQAAAVQTARTSLAEASVRGMIRRNPYSTLKELNNEKSGNPAVGALEFKDREVLRNSAEAEINRREAHARSIADHTDAVAQRALNEMDRQIASGVPATPAMWSAWEAKIKPSSFAGEFDDRVKGEREVQTLLRQPMDVQIKEVQDREAKLTTGGGTLAEATNLVRLKTAVTQNVKSMQETPLLFNANRTGAEVAPLDFSQAESPEGQQAIATQLHDRVDTINGMRKQYGDQVGMKVLLPQEAQALGSALQKANPTQSAQLFAQLHNAVGDDRAYQAIIQQIAPDSPVKAFAGLLAAKPRTATTGTHWFSPNDTAQSGDVAATILAGDALLSPSKDSKGQDGKPKAGLYLPEEKTLQDQFTREVGTAFAGRPDAAQNAFQAVKAYYVGKAAANGRIAANGQDIDTKIVREAVRSTLGEVVDMNGRGEVLAPWGMDESAFTSAARASLQAQDKAIAWPGGHPIAFDGLGLSAAGPNAYYVTAGRSYLTDKSGAPVVLKIGQ